MRRAIFRRLWLNESRLYALRNSRRNAFEDLVSLLMSIWDLWVSSAGNFFNNSSKGSSASLWISIEAIERSRVNFRLSQRFLDRVNRICGNSPSLFSSVCVISLNELSLNGYSKLPELSITPLIYLSIIFNVYDESITKNIRISGVERLKREVGSVVRFSYYKLSMLYVQEIQEISLPWKWSL